MQSEIELRRQMNVRADLLLQATHRLANELQALANGFAEARNLWVESTKPGRVVTNEGDVHELTETELRVLGRFAHGADQIGHDDEDHATAVALETLGCVQRASAGDDHVVWTLTAAGRSLLLTVIGGPTL